MKKILSKVNDKLNKIFDKIENRKELKKWNKLIEKACKKNSVKNSLFIKMYKGIQKEVLLRVNREDFENPENITSFKQTPLNAIVRQRIYDLNREFIFLINGEFPNSLYALTRQMIELYIRLIQCRYDKKLVEKLISEERQRGSIKGEINLLKQKVKLPYVKEMKGSKFLDSVINWFYYFSDLFHVSGISFSQNMWIFNEEKKNTRLYVQDPKLKRGEKLLIFLKKGSVGNTQYFTIIHQFYTFSGMCMNELKLMEDQEED